MPDSHIEASFAEKQKDSSWLARFNKVCKKANLSEWPVVTTSSPVTSVSNSQSANMVDNTSIHGVFSVLSNFSVLANIPKKVSPGLLNNFILDSGATTHICKDLSCFIDFHHTRQWLQHGDTGT